MNSLEKLQEEKRRLERELEKVSSEIMERSGHDGMAPVSPSASARNSSENDSTSSKAGGRSHADSISAPPSKSGYLFKWQDRSIGWGGTKWDLRFVRLERGRLSYFKTHFDIAPRYVLTLKNCAIRDDGFKLNKRYRSKDKNAQVSIRTPGAYYHVFSIYQRPKGAAEDNPTAELDDENGIVPLLRFSTESLAQKLQWMELLVESCAYCDSEYFREEDEALQSTLTNNGASALLASEHGTKGTLPLLYFAPPPVKIKRHPSHAGLKKNASHLKLNTGKDSAKSNSMRTSDYPPSKPMHRAAEPSYLSDEAPMQNYRGLLNLALIILVISNFRILLSTMQEYGFVLTHGIVGNVEDASWADIDYPLVLGLVLLNVFVISAFGIEYMLSSKVLPNAMGMTMHVINTNASLFVPMWLVWFEIESPLNGSILIMCATILWMKLISYVHANNDYRHYPERSNQTSTSFIQNIDESSKELCYPDNISLSNIFYFWFAPTLTYQIVFPRLPRRNIPRIMTLTVRLFLSFVLMVFLIAQIIVPNLKKMITELEEGEKMFSIHIFADYLMKLGMASTYIWLLVFYGYFHVFFNLLAEILKFGDRVFYRDWWNSSNLSSYWRLWNIPVHYWLVRHLYFPCIRIGMSKSGAMFTVFFFSAVFHELLISIPFHMIRTYSFLGMMSQIPLVMITKYLDKIRPGSSIGNFIFWLSFCILGQPMAVILYTIDYWKLHSDKGEGIIERNECSGSWRLMGCKDPSEL